MLEVISKQSSAYIFMYPILCVGDSSLWSAWWTHCNAVLHPFFLSRLLEASHPLQTALLFFAMLFAVGSNSELLTLNMLLTVELFSFGSCQCGTASSGARWCGTCCSRRTAWTWTSCTTPPGGRRAEADPDAHPLPHLLAAASSPIVRSMHVRCVVDRCPSLVLWCLPDIDIPGWMMTWITWYIIVISYAMVLHGVAILLPYRIITS